MLGFRKQIIVFSLVIRQKMSDPLILQSLSNDMENHQGRTYSSSQDQFILSLDQQIQALLPLKDSYVALQHYQHKIMQEYQTLIHDQDTSDHFYLCKIEELLMLNEELDMAKKGLVVDLRQIENQRAEVLLQRQKQMSACEALASKYNLENQQCMMMQDRTRDLLESIKKTQQNIGIYRKIIEEVQIQIRMKNEENRELKQNIAVMKQKNKRLTGSAACLQHSINKKMVENSAANKTINHSDSEINQLSEQCRKAMQKGRQLNQRILLRKEQLGNARHQKEYYAGLLESELLIKEDLNMSEKKLLSITQRRTQELSKLINDNDQWSQQIDRQEQKLQKNHKYKSALTEHLSELIKANTQLLEALQSFCSSDEKIYHVLNEKSNKLSRCCGKVKTLCNNDNIIKKERGVFEELKNEILLKTADETSKTWMTRAKNDGNTEN